MNFNTFKTLKSSRKIEKINTMNKTKIPSAIIAGSLFISGSTQALTFDELQGLTYLQVKGSGLANTCPVIEGGSSNLRELPSGNYNFDKFCMEPTSFKVKEESQLKGGEPDFVTTNLHFTRHIIKSVRQTSHKLSIHKIRLASFKLRFFFYLKRSRFHTKFIKIVISGWQFT